MSTQNLTEKGPRIPLMDPLCPQCKKPLKGMNVCGMLLPVPAADGKTIEKLKVYEMPCCPHCGIVLGVQLIEEREPTPAETPSGLWTPPGSH